MNQSLQKSIQISILIAKLVIPFSIASEVFQYLGYIEYVSFIFEPITEVLSLSPEVAISFAAAFFFNIYAGIAVGAGLGLNGYEWTIVGTFIAICHSIPLEAAVMKKVGFPIHAHWVTRLSAGLIGAWIASVLASDSLTTEVVSAQTIVYASFWDMLYAAIISALLLTVKIVLLVCALVIGFDLIRNISSIDLLMDKHTYLSSLTVGSLLGITYGAGILLKDIQLVKPDAKRNLLVFLLLAHGLVEETLIFAIFGADIAIIFGIRVAIAVAAVFCVDTIYKSKNRLAL